MHKCSNLLFFALILLGLISCANPGRDNSVRNETKDPLSSVMPPFEKLNVPYEEKMVASDAPSIVRFATGSSIEVPAGIFIDENNQRVTKPVQLLFREFHNAADIIASGIPMRVLDEHQKEDWMQTAGMFELLGYCEGKPVRIAPGENLKVNLASDVDGAFAFWYFNPEKGNWDNIGMSNAVPNPNFVAFDNESGSEELRPQPPAEPQAYDPSQPALNFDVNLEKLPELAKLKGVIWQYAGTDPEKDPVKHPWIFRHDWESAEIHPSPTANVYNLTLISQDSGNYNLPVRPSLSGKDLERARAQYAKMMEEYQQGLKLFKDKDLYNKQEMAFVRSLQVSGFGIHNCDVLYNLQNPIHVMADFDFGTAVPVNIKSMVTVYEIMGDGRTVVTYPFYRWEGLRISSTQRTKLVAVLPGNKLATFEWEDIKANLEYLKSSAENRFVFKMRVIDQPLKSVADLNQAIASAQ